MNTSENGRIRLYTSPQVAKIFHVHRITVVRWIRGGQIPARYVTKTLGGQYRIAADYIDGMLNGSWHSTDDVQDQPYSRRVDSSGNARISGDPMGEAPEGT